MTQPVPLDGEPTFELMARDPFAPALIRLWVAQRRLDVRNGVRPVGDLDQIERAVVTAERMETWRRDADLAWRDQGQLVLTAEMELSGPAPTDQAAFFYPEATPLHEAWLVYRKDTGE